MVSTHLKNISQNGNLPQVGVKIKNIWNHHLENQNVKRLLLFSNPLVFRFGLIILPAVQQVPKNGWKMDVYLLYLLTGTSRFWLFFITLLEYTPKILPNDIKWLPFLDHSDWVWSTSTYQSIPQDVSACLFEQWSNPVARSIIVTDWFF